jgi:hypothetical protein
MQGRDPQVRNPVQKVLVNQGGKHQVHKNKKAYDRKITRKLEKAGSGSDEA